MTAATTVAPIDAQTAYDLLAAAVELAGADHVYEIPEGFSGCRYVSDGNPSCIVGVSLAIHGVPLDVMREWDGSQDDMGTTIEYAPGADHFLSPGARAVFYAAQRVQDRVLSAGPIDAQEITWGKALEAAAATLAQLAER